MEQSEIHPLGNPLALAVPQFQDSEPFFLNVLLTDNFGSLLVKS